MMSFRTFWAELWELPPDVTYAVFPPQAVRDSAMTRTRNQMTAFLFRFIRMPPIDSAVFLCWFPLSEQVSLYRAAVSVFLGMMFHYTRKTRNLQRKTIRPAILISFQYDKNAGAIHRGYCTRKKRGNKMVAAAVFQRVLANCLISFIFASDLFSAPLAVKTPTASIPV